MNKRQAIKVVLEDEEAQEQAEISQLSLAARPSEQLETGPNQKRDTQGEAQVFLPGNNHDEFNWYEGEE